MKVRETRRFLFREGPDAGDLDYPYYGLETALVRLRRRNPSTASWRRRDINTWQCFDAAIELPSRAPEPFIYGLSQAWNETTSSVRP